MSPPKETIMILKVDLFCPRCYKKVKKILCSIPQIKDQVYNEKQNTVTIKVVCCRPEMIRDKLCCKGGKCIKSIDIVEPKKPALPLSPKPAPVSPPVQKPPPQEKPNDPEPVTKPPPPQPTPEPNQAPPTPPAPAPAPVNVCCSDCYQGRNTGPCYHGYGVPPPLLPGGWYYWYYDGCGSGGYGYSCRPGYYVSQCCDYINEENPTACVIM